MIEITEITSPDEKSAICDLILRLLPDWFGIESSIIDYVDESRCLPFYAAFDGGKAVGFVAIKEHNQYTAEVCVMGVLSQYHRMGLGKRLIGCCDRFCEESQKRFLTVKTLDGSSPDEGYAKTRRFYLSMGFSPLEVFPTLWDEHNPCLFMAKYIGISGN